MATKIEIFVGVAMACVAAAVLNNENKLSDVLYFKPSGHENTAPDRWIQLKIINTNTTWITHIHGGKITEFSPVFEKDFLHQVLDLLQIISQLRYISVGKNIGWNDVCYRGDYYCYMNSFLQYFGLSHSNLDEVMMGPYGILVLWDYLDHFQMCTNSKMFGFDYSVNISCTDANKRPILPSSVLTGFNGASFQNATALMVTMLFSTDKTPDDFIQWQNEMTKRVRNYNNPNMTITIFRPPF